MCRRSSRRKSPDFDDTDVLRLFAAVDLPDEFRFRLAGLKRDFPGIRWTLSENMHLTLRFIGEVGRQEADAARNALRATRVAPFSLCLHGLGVFERRHQTVLWAGLGFSAPLVKLKRQVDTLLADAIGLAPERGRYAPHVTLSRMRTGVVADLHERIAGYGFAGESFAVESFTLFHSVLSPAGAAYFPLELYPLGSAVCLRSSARPRSRQC